MCLRGELSLCTCEVTLFGNSYCVRGWGQMGRAVRFRSCISRGCWLATSYRSPPQQRIVCPSENFTFSLRSLGKRMGTKSAEKRTGPAPGMTLALNLCVGTAVNGCPTAPTEPGAFICGVKLNLLVIASVGNWITAAKVRTNMTMSYLISRSGLTGLSFQVKHQGNASLLWWVRG